ncbi:enolase C-terminal domain-like protein [Thermomonospora curvata]|uniref:Mandelate racemase/muconate lactonizing protein n=2 Tax=Thermomonospora TaxID=2019 RepID=D1A518_THECD|nr:enolase C-terminal domain-like protein [Thermomonospora curvata]ACY98187.1 Mandelate racemase/muconate lactonizing protein [Thermomonospora curvata DSM 43183]PKK13999.1 MAG: O-succinylbenzoate synthase [Thermomonospora sp. CIF 1]
MPRIQDCQAFKVAMPRGRRPQSILVRLTNEDGTTGWGEVAFPEPPDSTWADISERLAPALLGLEWERPEDVSATVEFGTRPAAAAVDIACWDLWCRLKGLPLAHALGGTRTSIVTGTRIDTAPFLIDALISRVNQAVGSGHTRVTLKVRPGWDIEPVRAVRAAYPALAVVVDACGSYTESEEHLETLQALDAYGLVAIERPFPAGDLAAHARLQQRLETAVCPQISDLDMLEAAIEQRAGRMLHLDISLMGGLTAARGAHDRAYAAGWDVWCGGSGAFGIGQAAAVALAGLPGCTLPSDVTDPAGGPAFVSPPVRSHGGVVGVPLTQPGLGHQVDEERIAKLATDTRRIPA